MKQKIKISEIIIPEGRRSVDSAKVSALAESIKIVGLLNPIAIDRNKRLIAGAHRRAAHVELGRDEIECVILDCDELQMKLVEIDENLIRNDLDPIGIGEQAIERDKILEEMGKRAKSGDNRFSERDAESAPLKTTADIANEIGLSKRVLQENKQLARTLTDRAKEAVRKIDAPKRDALRLARKNKEEQDTISQKILDESAKTITEAIRVVEREKLKADLESIATKRVKKAYGVYDVIVIDPPWDLGMVELNAIPKQAGLDYPTMTEQELADLQIPAAADCHLWIWAPQRFLPVTFRLLEVWGFTYSCTFVWHKPDGIQPPWSPKYNCEFVVYARRGTPQFIDTKAFYTCFEAPRGKHSEKPEAFYGVVRRVTAGRRLDMFNRRMIEGFDGWGQEAK